jgi:hypothetical protein|tara:strand:+ start:2404 stop:2976 length:573 start_codon:yes stop_codon:yes gene_type:complete
MGYVYVPNWFNGLIKILSILICVILFTLFITVYGLRHIVRNNWSVYRCDPFVMPFAGFFGYEPVSNFNNCIRLNVKETSKPLFSPYNDVIGAFQTNLNAQLGSLTDVGIASNISRTNTTFALSDIMGKMGNVATTTEFLMIKIKSIFQKILALYITLLYAGWSMIKGMEAIAKDKGIKKGMKLVDSVSNF